MTAVTDYLQAYAAKFELPVRLSTNVTSLTTRGSALLGWVRNDAAFLARQIACQ